MRSRSPVPCGGARSLRHILEIFWDRCKAWFDARNSSFVLPLTIITMAEVCASCKKPLVVEIEDDEDDVEMEGSSSQPNTVPDDCQLSCGCHFHW